MAGRTTIVITVTGEREIQRELAKRRAPQLTTTIRVANEAGAQTAKPFLQVAAPVRTGLTAATVVRRGTWVGPTVDYRFPVIKGVPSHNQEANPWVQRGFTRARPAVRTAQHRVITARNRL